MLNPNLALAKQHDIIQTKIKTQIRNYSADKRKVSPEIIRRIYAKVALERKPEDIRLVCNFLYLCPMFQQLRETDAQLLNEVSKHFKLTSYDMNDKIESQSINFVLSGQVLYNGNILSAQQQFGQLNQNSLATCLQPTEVLQLSQQVYDESVIAVKKRQTLHMTEFLQSVRLFKNMPLKSLQAAIPVFKEVRFDYNRILYRLNEPPKGIYIVKSGQFDLIVPQSFEKQAKLQADRLQADPGVTLKLLKQQQIKKEFQQATTLVVLSRGELIGLEECVTLQNRQHTVRCSLTGSSAYFVSLDDFDNVLKPELGKAIKNELILKAKFNQARQAEKERTLDSDGLVSALDHTCNSIIVDYAAFLMNAVSKRNVSITPEANLALHKVFSDKALFGLSQRSPSVVSQTVQEPNISKVYKCQKSINDQQRLQMFKNDFQPDIVSVNTATELKQNTYYIWEQPEVLEKPVTPVVQAPVVASVKDMKSFRQELRRKSKFQNNEFEIKMPSQSNSLQLTTESVPEIPEIASKPSTPLKQPSLNSQSQPTTSKIPPELPILTKAPKKVIILSEIPNSSEMLLNTQLTILPSVNQSPISLVDDQQQLPRPMHTKRHSHNVSRSDSVHTFEESTHSELSPMANNAAQELMQQFLNSPTQQVSAQQFIRIKDKHRLSEKEAQFLLLQQIKIQKAFSRPTEASTVVKLSTESYLQYVKQQRQDRIAFRNQLRTKYSIKNIK